MSFKLYVRAIIINPQGQVLLAQKQPNQAIAAGKWILPGGTIEFGETPIIALKRELAEEINLQFKDQVLVGTETIVLGETHWLGLYYHVFGDVTDVKNLEPEKHAKLEWCTMDFVKATLTAEVSSWILSQYSLHKFSNA